MGWFKNSRKRTKCTETRDTTSQSPDTQCASNQPKGFLPVKAGQAFSGARYTALSQIGKGLYSTVWRAHDHQTGDQVAIKILSSDFYNGGIRLFEVDIMRRIRAISATSCHPGKDHVAQLIDDFEHDGPAGRHVCLVLQLLGESVSDQSTQMQRSRLPYSNVKQVAKQLLQAVDFLHKECQVIHTDIQTSNILIDIGRPGQVKSGRMPSLFLDRNIRIRLTDFGLACWDDEHLTDRIQPPMLRAPEIYLDAPWEGSVDIYDLGCLIYYLVTGALPFPGRPSSSGEWTEEDDRLKTMMEIFGSVPEIVLANASRTDHFFDENRELRRSSGNESTPLEGIVNNHTRRSSLGTDMPQEEIPQFCEFLRGMLATDPRKRKSAQDMLKHSWLQ